MNKIVLLTGGLLAGVALKLLVGKKQRSLEEGEGLPSLEEGEGLPGGNSGTLPVEYPETPTPGEPIIYTAPEEGTIYVDNGDMITTYIPGTVQYDVYLTHQGYQAAGGTLHPGYTDSYVRDYYRYIELYGPTAGDSGYFNKSPQAYQIVKSYCPMTYFPTAVEKYNATLVAPSESGTTEAELNAAYLAASQAKQALKDYQSIWQPAIYDYESGRITEAQYQIFYKEFRRLRNAATQALKYYHSIGGTMMVW